MNFKQGSRVRFIGIDSKIRGGLVGRVLGSNDMGVMVEWNEHIYGHDGTVSDFSIPGKDGYCWYVLKHDVVPHNSKFEQHLQRMKNEV